MPFYRRSSLDNVDNPNHSSSLMDVLIADIRHSTRMRILSVVVAADATRSL